MGTTKRQPGKVRDAILGVLAESSQPLAVKQIEGRVNQILGPTSSSSIRSYLRLNTPELFVRESRGVYRARMPASSAMEAGLSQSIVADDPFVFGNARLFLGDCIAWLARQPDNSIHAVVTDPPYGLHEYSAEQQSKLRNGKGGVWRIPPSFDGHVRSPLPRFTTLTSAQLDQLHGFFRNWGEQMLLKLVPGANVIVASNPLLSYVVSVAIADAGFERRGEIARLVMTMRGGDRPKAAHLEFDEVSVMPRSMWEPWLIFRKPIEGRVQDNLRKWKTGGFRRPSEDKPFGDVIQSAPTRKNERALAPHPSLKPQAFLRRIVRAALPLGEGVVLDPFAGSGSTLAAAGHVGYSSIGIESDPEYYEMACTAIPRLTAFEPGPPAHKR